SALDPQTERALRAALFDQAARRTRLIVAHRLETIRHAEQILVLDDGEMVGKGTHAQLMRDCEVYRQIALSQLSKEELDNGKEK
ncbi:MAG: ABC transporter ATP-binding protein, partial [Clostridia bacterium]